MTRRPNNSEGGGFCLLVILGSWPGRCTPPPANQPWLWAQPGMTTAPAQVDRVCREFDPQTVDLYIYKGWRGSFPDATAVYAACRGYTAEKFAMSFSLDAPERNGARPPCPDRSLLQAALTGTISRTIPAHRAPPARAAVQRHGFYRAPSSVPRRDS